MEERHRRDGGGSWECATGRDCPGGPDPVGERDVLSRLGDPSFWPLFVHVPVTGSTNTVAARMAEQGAPHGTVVVADAQTEGRGRLGRRWESPPGINLYVSLLLRPPVDPARAPEITLVAGVALARAVEEAAGVRSSLKWPNDLYLGGRKAAGILAETATGSGLLRHVVVGTGINVNAAPGDFPPGIRERATSLAIEAGRPVPRAPLLAAYLDAFAGAYGRYVGEGLPALLPEWRRRSLLDGARVVVRLPEGDVPGTALGIDASGALLVRRDGDAEATRIYGGEIVSFGG